MTGEQQKRASTLTSRNTVQPLPQLQQPVLLPPNRYAFISFISARNTKTRYHSCSVIPGRLHSSKSKEYLTHSQILTRSPVSETVPSLHFTLSFQVFLALDLVKLVSLSSLD